MPPCCDVLAKADPFEVPYLETTAIRLRVKNTSPNDVRIHKVALVFERDDGSLSERQVVNIPDVEVSPGQSTDLSVAAEMDLLYHPESNLFGVWLYLRERAGNAWNNVPDEYYPRRSSVRIVDRPKLQGHVFISFKDPENYALASSVGLFLERAGFDVYIARDDHAVGTNVWRSKIPEAIRRSTGLIVLWTHVAALNPRGILREIDIAKQYRICPLPVVESGCLLTDHIDEAPDIEQCRLPAGAGNYSGECAQFAEDVRGLYVTGRLRVLPMRRVINWISSWWVKG